MKVVILAGGLGTRISEETDTKPKPMVEIGGMPIIWHIMKLYNFYGINDFIICCGYKGYVIKEFFANYFIHTSDVTIDLGNNKIHVHKKNGESWKVTLVDTGINSMTGGRLKRVKDYLDRDEIFCMTYGDGLSDINILDLINFHKKSKAEMTLSAAKAPGRFGVLNINKNKVDEFTEKSKDAEPFVNAGFFVLNSSVIDYIKDDYTVFEKEPLEKLAKLGKLAAFKHEGFWQPMDTLRDKIYLETLIQENKAPWKKWQ
jgi:glucose-1-phosphate cytidylyltransferase